MREQTMRDGVTYRDNYLAYDALGRLKLAEDGRAQVIMDYDLVGNRTRIETHVITAQAATAVGSQVEGAHDADDYFRYGQTSYLKSGWMIQSDGSIKLNTPFSGFTRNGK